MPILAGGIVTAYTLDLIQPRPYYAAGSGTLNGPQTATDITGASITLTTLTNDAVFTAVGTFDFDLTGATTGGASGRLVVDGVAEAELATFGAEVTTDRASPGQTWHGTLPAAGSHTLKLGTTLPTNMSVQGIYCTLLVTIYEVY